MTTIITAPTIQYHALGAAATINTVVSALTTEINKHIQQTDYPHSDLANATNAPTASAIAKRDATGSLQFVAVGILPVAGAGVGVNVVAPAGYTGQPFAYTLNGVSKFYVDASGIIQNGTVPVGNLSGAVAIANGGTGATTAAAALAALGGAPLTGAGTSGTWPIGISGNAATATSATSAASATNAYGVYPRAVGAVGFADLALTGTGTSNTLTYTAGGFVNSTGALVSIGATNVTIVPSTTGARWFVTWLTDAGGTNQAQSADGGVRSSVTAPTSAAWMPFWVYVPQNCVGIYSTATDWQNAGSPANKGYVDIRPMNPAGAAGGGGGGGGTDTGVRAQAVLTRGNATSVISGGQDVTNAGQAIGIHPANVSTATANDGTLLDLTRDLIPGTLPTYLTASGATVTLNVGSGTGNPNYAFAINGRYCTIAAPVTSNAATGSAGPRNIMLDINGGANSPKLFVQTGGPANAYQRQIGAAWWDGTVLQVTGPNGRFDWSPLLNLSSNQLSMDQVGPAYNSATDTYTTSVSTFTRPPNGPTLAFYLATQCRVRITTTCFWQYTAAGVATSYWVLDTQYAAAGASYQQAAHYLKGRIHIPNGGGTSYIGDSVEKTMDIVGLAPGSYTVAQALTYVGTAGEAGGINLLDRSLAIDILKG